MSLFFYLFTVVISL